MAAPVPGLPSFGDIVTFIDIINQGIKILKAHGETGSDYEQCVQFLECVQITVRRATDHVANEPNSAYASDLRKSIELLVAPWTKFHTFLKKYESTLAAGTKPNPSKEVLKSLKFAMKEVRGEVRRFKVDIGLPLGTALFTIGLHSL